MLASGVDPHTKHTLDQTIKQLRQTDVTIFVVGVDKPISNYPDASQNGGPANLSFLQGENQLKTFTSMADSWFTIRPGIMREVAAFLRHQYSLTYTPSNHTPDGKYRKG